MPQHLLRDLDFLKKQLIDICSLVEESITKATMALIDRRIDMAEEVVAGDDRIDDKEVQLEEECLKTLALNQPVAADLRFIIVVLKVNNDLERMGDLACNIAERAIFLASHDPFRLQTDIPLMTQEVCAMVRKSLDSLTSQDPEKANQVRLMDDRIDKLHRTNFEVVEKAITEDPSIVTRANHFLSASRNLERIADLANNIAEDVIFMVEGEMVRHDAPDAHDAKS